MAGKFATANEKLPAMECLIGTKRFLPRNLLNYGRGSNVKGEYNRRETMKDIFGEGFNWDEFWFWLFLPITGTIWILGEILAAFRFN